jgi:CHAD domain-containing protein
MVDFLLRPEASFRNNIIRIATSLNTDASHHLTKKTDIHESIHNARVCFKKLRAVLRLTQPQIGKKTYDLENKYYRDTSKKLSFLRDYTASIEAIDELLKNRRSVESVAMLNSLKRKLQLKRATTLRNAGIDDLFGSIQNHNLIARTHIPTWELDGEEKENLAKALSKNYRKAHKLYLRVAKEPTETNVHEWRKATKYFMYMVQLLRPLWPTMFAAYARELNTLTDFQGKHHDLCVLEHQLHHIKATTKLNPKTLKSLKASIVAQKKGLIAQGLESGSRVFAFEAKELGKLVIAWLPKPIEKENQHTAKRLTKQPAKTIV